jgi:hypothetical protein
VHLCFSQKDWRWDQLGLEASIDSGSGVRVIVVGEKGKRDVELFDPKTVK